MLQGPCCASQSPLFTRSALVTIASRMKTLRVGDWVEVRTPKEILATLDKEGCLDSLPFMPEMMQYCGKTFPISKSAHKSCNTLGGGGIRRMADAVHLEGLRCDGASHGGCQAACLLFWKTAWLKPVAAPETGGPLPRLRDTPRAEATDRPAPSRPSSTRPGP